LFEQTRAQKHRVCGEFLSSEIAPLLRSIGLWDEFQRIGPQIYRRLVLHFPSITKCAPLREAAWGVSRRRFDLLLRGYAERLGATVTAARGIAAEAPVVLASGRRHQAPRGQRLFGFKSHFVAPVSDSIELFFFQGAYVGVNCVEDGITNVCGVAPESLLRKHDFCPDALLQEFPPLRERLSGAARLMDWLRAGPLVFGNKVKRSSEPGVYRAGDVLKFVDPFTGSGLVSAVYSGLSAGRAAAGKRPVSEHVARCRRAFRQPLLVSSFFRWAWLSGNADALVRYVPHRLEWLLSLTRPRCVLEEF
jgi:flavin-dependent dehydrogenase